MEKKLEMTSEEVAAGFALMEEFEYIETKVEDGRVSEIKWVEWNEKQSEYARRKRKGSGQCPDSVRTVSNKVEPRRGDRGDRGEERDSPKPPREGGNGSDEPSTSKYENPEDFRGKHDAYNLILDCIAFRDNPGAGGKCRLRYDQFRNLVTTFPKADLVGVVKERCMLAENSTKPIGDVFQWLYYKISDSDKRGGGGGSPGMAQNQTPVMSMAYIDARNQAMADGKLAEFQKAEWVEPEKPTERGD